jgi:hypothetical protein
MIIIFQLEEICLIHGPFFLYVETLDLSVHCITLTVLHLQRAYPDMTRNAKLSTPSANFVIEEDRCDVSWRSDHVHLTDST